MFLMCRITESKRQQNELNKQKITEKELSNLNQKINKLLTKLEEHEQEAALNIEEECVICITSKATISTFPCGHTVICRRCFVKTIQNSVQQKHLPLKCVICREKILRLKQSFTGNSLSLAETSRSSRYRRQTRVHQSNQSSSTQYTKKNKKSEPSLSYSMPSQNTCKKKTAIHQSNNDQQNAMQSIKIELGKTIQNDSTQLTSGQETGEQKESIKECQLDKESNAISTEVEFENANYSKVDQLKNSSPIKLENDLERIEKLNKLSKRKPLNVKTKFFNYFSAMADTKNKEIRKQKIEEISYSLPKKMKNTWFGRFKNKMSTYSNEMKVLFNF